jgi:hypothetical protein
VQFGELETIGSPVKSLGGNDTAPKIEKKAYLKYSALLD